MAKTHRTGTFSALGGPHNNNNNNDDDDDDDPHRIVIQRGHGKRRQQPATAPAPGSSSSSSSSSSSNPKNEGSGSSTTTNNKQETADTTTQQQQQQQQHNNNKHHQPAAAAALPNNDEAAPAAKAVSASASAAAERQSPSQAKSTPITTTHGPPNGSSCTTHNTEQQPQRDTQQTTQLQQQQPPHFIQPQPHQGTTTSTTPGPTPTPLHKRRPSYHIGKPRPAALIVPSSSTPPPAQQQPQTRKIHQQQRSKTAKVTPPPPPKLAADNNHSEATIMTAAATAAAKGGAGKAAPGSSNRKAAASAATRLKRNTETTTTNPSPRFHHHSNKNKHASSISSSSATTGSATNNNNTRKTSKPSTTASATAATGGASVASWRVQGDARDWANKAALCVKTWKQTFPHSSNTPTPAASVSHAGRNSSSSPVANNGNNKAADQAPEAQQQRKKTAKAVLRDVKRLREAIRANQRRGTWIAAFVNARGLRHLEAMLGAATAATTSDDDIEDDGQPQDADAKASARKELQEEVTMPLRRTLLEGLASIARARHKRATGGAPAVAAAAWGSLVSRLLSLLTAEQHDDALTVGMSVEILAAICGVNTGKLMKEAAGTLTTPIASAVGAAAAATGKEAATQHGQFSSLGSTSSLGGAASDDGGGSSTTATGSVSMNGDHHAGAKVVLAALRSDDTPDDALSDCVLALAEHVRTSKTATSMKGEVIDAACPPELPVLPLLNALAVSILDVDERSLFRSKHVGKAVATLRQALSSRVGSNGDGGGGVVNGDHSYRTASTSKHLAWLRVMSREVKAFSDVEDADEAQTSRDGVDLLDPDAVFHLVLRNAVLSGRESSVLSALRLMLTIPVEREKAHRSWSKVNYILKAALQSGVGASEAYGVSTPVASPSHGGETSKEKRGGGGPLNLEELKVALVNKEAADRNQEKKMFESLRGANEALRAEVVELRKEVVQLKKLNGGDEDIDASAGKNANSHVEKEEAGTGPAASVVSGAPPPEAPPMAPPLAPPMAPPMGGSVANSPNTGMQARADGPTPSVPMKKFHWSVLPASRVAGSCWADILQQDAETHVPLDAKVLEKLFAAKQEFKKKNDCSVGDKDGSRKPQVRVKLLPAQRAYAIDIGLSRFSMSHEMLRDAIAVLDERILNADLVTKLIKYVPTDEEMAMVRNFAKTEGDSAEAQLSNADHFFFVLSQFDGKPGIRTRLELFLFRQQFSYLVGSAMESLGAVIRTLNAMRSSVALRSVFRHVLALGNFLNCGSNKGGAYGFKLSTLAQLSSVHTADNKSNLIVFLAQHLRKHEPSALAFIDDLAGVGEARRMESSALAADVAKIEGSLKLMTKVLEDPEASLGDCRRFVTPAGRTVEQLAELLKDANKKSESLVEYFGEDPEKFTWEQLFGVFHSFRVQFMATLKKIDRVEAALARKKKRSEAAQERRSRRRLAAASDSSGKRKKKMLRRFDAAGDSSSPLVPTDAVLPSPYASASATVSASSSSSDLKAMSAVSSVSGKQGTPHSGQGKSHDQRGTAAVSTSPSTQIRGARRDEMVKTSKNESGEVITLRTNGSESPASPSWTWSSGSPTNPAGSAVPVENIRTPGARVDRMSDVSGGTMENQHIDGGGRQHGRVLSARDESVRRQTDLGGGSERDGGLHKKSKSSGSVGGFRFHAGTSSSKQRSKQRIADTSSLNTSTWQDSATQLKPVDRHRRHDSSAKVASSQSRFASRTQARDPRRKLGHHSGSAGSVTGTNAAAARVGVAGGGGVKRTKTIVKTNSTGGGEKGDSPSVDKRSIKSVMKAVGHTRARSFDSFAMNLGVMGAQHAAQDVASSELSAMDADHALAAVNVGAESIVQEEQRKNESREARKAAAAARRAESAAARTLPVRGSKMYKTARHAATDMARQVLESSTAAPSLAVAANAPSNKPGKNVCVSCGARGLKSFCVKCGGKMTVVVRDSASPAPAADAVVVTAAVVPNRNLGGVVGMSSIKMSSGQAGSSASPSSLARNCTFCGAVTRKRFCTGCGRPTAATASAATPGGVGLGAGPAGKKGAVAAAAFTARGASVAAPIVQKKKVCRSCGAPCAKAFCTACGTRQ